MKRARTTGDSSSSRVSHSLEAGIIKKLRLENFMCHSNHETEFGNHVNVITGQNGSMLFSSSLITFTLPLYLFIFPFEIVIFIFYFFCNLLKFTFFRCMCRFNVDVLSFGKFMYRAIAMGFLERILRACLDGGY
jgi:hypothetical protein